jgi:hypothetical protein
LGNGFLFIYLFHSPIGFVLFNLYWIGGNMKTKCKHEFVHCKIEDIEDNWITLLRMVHRRTGMAIYCKKCGDTKVLI